MQASVVLGDLKKPEDVKKLQQILEELYDLFDLLYETTDPDGNVQAQRGKLCIFFDGSKYHLKKNVDGGTTWEDSDLWEVDGNETQLKTADEIDMQSKKIINVTDPTADQDAATKKYADDNDIDTLPLSNVVFCWSGNDSYSANNYGMNVSTTQSLDLAGADSAGYINFVNDTTTYQTFLNFKFKKTAGINTITIHARLWGRSAAGGSEAVLNVDVGGQSNTVQSVTSSTPSWVATADIDVSGLTDGTVYDGIVQLKAENNADEVFCSAVTLIGS